MPETEIKRLSGIYELKWQDWTRKYNLTKHLERFEAHCIEDFRDGENGGWEAFNDHDNNNDGWVTHEEIMFNLENRARDIPGLDEDDIQDKIEEFYDENYWLNTDNMDGTPGFPDFNLFDRAKICAQEQFDCMLADLELYFNKQF